MLNSRQRAQLRGMANTYEAIFQVGKGGISENLIKSLSDALEARELIKVSVLNILITFPAPIILTVSFSYTIILISVLLIS